MFLPRAAQQPAVSASTSTGNVILPLPRQDHYPAPSKKKEDKTKEELLTLLPLEIALKDPVWHFAVRWSQKPGVSKKEKRKRVQMK